MTENNVNKRKEILIFLTLILGFGFIGLAGDRSGFCCMIGLALLIWVFWRGRKL